MKFVYPVVGIVLIGSALHDVFHTLFHPAGRGAMSDYAARVVWNIFHPMSRRRPRLITLAGPFAILTIMGLWVWLTVFGFALIYTPYIQSRYVFASGITYHHRNFSDALNVSLGSLITLVGDINATTRSLRLLMGLEAIVGLGLLTASVSWLLSLYPIIERRRTTGHQVNLLHNAELDTGLNLLDLPSSEAQELLWGLAAQICELRNDVTQFPISYYFHTGEHHSGLAGGLPYLAEIAEEGSRPHQPPSVRVACVSLGGAIDDYLTEIAEILLRMPTHNKDEIMRRYAEDQLREIYRRPDNSHRPAA